VLVTLDLSNSQLLTSVAANAFRNLTALVNLYLGDSPRLATIHDGWLVGPSLLQTITLQVRSSTVTPIVLFPPPSISFSASATSFNFLASFHNDMSLLIEASPKPLPSLVVHRIDLDIT
jgi:hypothetical protein